MFQFRLRTLFLITALAAGNIALVRGSNAPTSDVVGFSAVLWLATLGWFFAVSRIVRSWDGSFFSPAWPAALGLSVLFAGGMYGILVAPSEIEWFDSDWFGAIKQLEAPLSIGRDARFEIDAWLKLGATTALVAGFFGSLSMFPAVVIVGAPLIALLLCYSIRIPFAITGSLWGALVALFAACVFSDYQLTLLMFTTNFGFVTGVWLDIALRGKKLRYE